MTGSLLFQGLTDQTIAHDQRWLFAQLGKYLERITVTCRVIETKFKILQQAEAMLEAPLRNIHWMAVLRSCCSIEAYRRMHVGDMDPLKRGRLSAPGKEFSPQRAVRRSSRASRPSARCAARSTR